MNESELYDFIKDQLAYYKVSDKIVIVSELMTASGMISRIQLPEKMKKQLAEELEELR